MKLYLILSSIVIFNTDAFFYGDFMKVRYIKNNIHVLDAESNNDECIEKIERFCLSVNVIYHMIPKYDINKEIKKTAVATGYIQAFKNWLKSINIVNTGIAGPWIFNKNQSNHTITDSRSLT
jgi:hypothetical protein